MTKQIWKDVRGEFLLDPPKVNLAAVGMSVHLEAVRDAIDDYRERLDQEGFAFVSRELLDAELRVRQAASTYFGSDDKQADNIALIDNTTQGLALLYAGLKIGKDQHILASKHEFAKVFECFQTRQLREGRTDLFREVDLFGQSLPELDEDEVLERLQKAVNDHTRVLALTWVYSNTGVKLPIARIGHWIKEVNAKRTLENKIIFCVDGVHGFGVEDATFAGLECDFLVAGCHKALFGPRGSAVWFGTEEAWTQVVPVVPSSTATLGVNSTPANQFTPGGIHSYEHRWALNEAFNFLNFNIGKRQVQERVHALATTVKKALHGMSHVHLITPMNPKHSSGLICFDINEFRQDPTGGALGLVNAAIQRLKRAGIVATTSSSDRANPGQVHLRLSVSIFNTEEEIDRALSAIQELAP